MTIGMGTTTTTMTPTTERDVMERRQTASSAAF
jgi:hypothetical protein